MTLIVVMTSLESPIPEVAVKDTIKEGITEQGVNISVHINSLNGGTIVTKPMTHNIVLL